MLSVNTFISATNIVQSQKCLNCDKNEEAYSKDQGGGSPHG